MFPEVQILLSCCLGLFIPLTSVFLIQKIFLWSFNEVTDRFHSMVILHVRTRTRGLPALLDYESICEAECRDTVYSTKTVSTESCHCQFSARYGGGEGEADTKLQCDPDTFQSQGKGIPYFLCPTITFCSFNLHKLLDNVTFVQSAK